MVKQAIIALGGNIGDTRAYFCYARKSLAQHPRCQLGKVSALYRSVAIGPAQDDYFNAALLLHTSLPALALLDELQAIESQCHRLRQQHWGPRTLDLDIIDYNGQCMHSERLILPHPEAQQRAFVLQPIQDMLPQWQHPRLQQTVSTLLQSCRHDDLLKIDDHW